MPWWILAACGPGVARETGACEPGETRACVGAGACEGGQLCRGDATWSSCDCGAATDGDTDTDTDTDADTVPTHLDLADVEIWDNPSDVARWPITTTLTLVEFGSDVHVEFSKQDGEDRWPDVTPPGWDGPLQYTLGLVESIDGRWVGSACMQYWYGLYGQGGNVALDRQVAVNWYYDARWGPLEGRQPATGEIVGVFVVAGNVRGVADGSQSPVWERSDVVLVPFPDVSGATHAFP